MKKTDSASTYALLNKLALMQTDLFNSLRVPVASGHQTLVHKALEIRSQAAVKLAEAAALIAATHEMIIKVEELSEYESGPEPAKDPEGVPQGDA